MKKFTAIIFFLTAPLYPSEWQTFCCREAPHVELYRAEVPDSWRRQEITLSVDTMLPIAEFSVPAEDEMVRITVHTFPVSEKIPRIPAAAQVARWKRQWDEQQTQFHTAPCRHGGFAGLIFSAEDQQRKVVAWTMQLAPEYDRVPSTLKADYTIKATGSIQAIDLVEVELTSFANSFELIEELPAPT